MEDPQKNAYLGLHFDLTNAIDEMRLALVHLQTAQINLIHVYSEPEMERPQLDLTTRAAVSTGLALIIPAVETLLVSASAAQVPCECLYPQLATNQTSSAIQ